LRFARVTVIGKEFWFVNSESLTAQPDESSLKEPVTERPATVDGMTSKTKKEFEGPE
jgi:hypothetical protein